MKYQSCPSKFDFDFFDLQIGFSRSLKMTQQVSSLVLSPPVINKLIGWVKTCNPHIEISKRPLNDTYTLWNNLNYGEGRVCFIENTKTRTVAARIDLRNRDPIRIEVEYVVEYDWMGEIYKAPDPFPNLDEIVKSL